MGSETSRVYFRLPCEFKIKYQRQTQDGPKSSTARACDISTNGLGFITDTAFPMGEMLAVTFRLPGSWKKFRIVSQVRHQTIRKTTPKPVYLTGIQFAPETDPGIINDIGNFIVKKTNFLGIRMFVFLGAALLAVTALFRSFNVGLIQYYLATAAGTEWFLASGQWWKDILKIYILANLLVAAALCAGGFGFLLIGKHTRKFMAGLVLLTAAVQCGRVVLKAGFISRDPFFQATLGWEILILLTAAGLFLLLSRKKFAGRFDSYRENLGNHLRY